MRRGWFFGIADALAEVERADQRGDAGGDVNHGAAGKVEAGNPAVERGVEESAFAPDHVRHGRIDDDGPEGEEEAHCAEFHPLGEGSGNERGRDDGEHELVDHVGLRGDGGAVIGIGREADAVHEGVVQAADESIAGAESQAVADQRPEHGDDAHHGEALHHRGENVLAADETAIEEGEAWTGHHEHQRGAGEHPGVIAGRDCGSGRCLGQRGRGATKGEQAEQPNQTTRVHITPLACDGNMSRRGDR